jgi:saccharopine dehydrogenase-like NADP-dependent oxidoreductase
MATVLIIGGTGRIGQSIAQDILNHTQAQVVITGRNPVIGESVTTLLGSRSRFQLLILGDLEQLQQAIAGVDLVIHTAGPFHDRDTRVLQTCIQHQVNYLDVSDERSFTQRALSQSEAAVAAGITAIINTGVFPGISNSMVRQGIDNLDQADSIRLSYVVAGSGGAGVTVMRTTFIGLQHPFAAWLDRQWQTIQPYTEPEAVNFPPPYGQANVYWYDMPEAVTLPTAFPQVKDVITKFGIVPDFYNHLTWIAAHWFPRPWLQNSVATELLAQVSYRMTQVTDTFSGTGVAVHCQVLGQKAGQDVCYQSTYVHESAATATGYGTGSLAQLMLEGKIQQPGVWAVEQVLPTDLFERSMQQRQQKVLKQLDVR